MTSDDVLGGSASGAADEIVRPALPVSSTVVTSAEPADSSARTSVRAEIERVGEETIAMPGKVMRIGSMVKRLLEEVRQAPLDEAGRVRLREIYEISVRELASGLSDDLAQELDTVAIPFERDATPSEAELRVAQAQLVGWLEGLFHGIQATLFAQQMAAHSQLEEIQRRGLPAPEASSSERGRAGASEGPRDASERPGTYL
ncbi:MAG: proteasome activator [Acidimicrobiales bacterium]